MDRLFITTKDRASELAILCKSLLHSDMRSYISEVVFLDDHSEDPDIHRIYSAFMFAVLPIGIKTRFLEAKDGRGGINQSLERIRHYPCNNIWILNGDMLVLSDYFSRCKTLQETAQKNNQYRGSIIVSGFNTPIHKPITITQFKAIVTSSVGGCSILTDWNNLNKLLECFGAQKSMNRGWDLHIGEVFDNILVTNPSASQHIGILSGLNQLYLSGFPGAWANIT